MRARDAFRVANCNAFRVGTWRGVNGEKGYFWLKEQFDCFEASGSLFDEGFL